jgi:DDE superfamily endonuclease
MLEHLADEAGGVLIVDETGFLKKGEKSVGVARQYTGTAGDTVNCQVGVFLAYSSEKGAALLDRTLYLPRAWTNAPARRAEAGVPTELVFCNKVELAQELLERAFEADVSAKWVRPDSYYGRSHAFRAWLEERGRPYAVMVPKTNAVPLVVLNSISLMDSLVCAIRFPAKSLSSSVLHDRYGASKNFRMGPLRRTLEEDGTLYVERLPKDAFSEVRPAPESSGGRLWECACLRRWLLVRRSTDDPEDLGFYQAYGPQGTTVEELVGVCQEHWAVEE